MKKNFLFFLLILTTTLQAQNINIPDANLKNLLLRTTFLSSSGTILNLDANADGEISIQEAALLIEIRIRHSDAVANIAGLEQFPNLRKVDIMELPLLTSLDFRLFPALTSIFVFSNPLLEELLVSGTNITKLQCNYNRNLTAIDLSGLTLKELDLSDNSLTQLIAHLNDSQYGMFYAFRNQLTDVQISGNIKKISISENQLTNLDLSNIKYQEADFTATPLLTLNIKNGF